MWILTFMVGSFISSIFLRVLFGKQKYFHKEFEKEGYDKGYEKGYKDGAVNVKMFYSMKMNLPSAGWLSAQKGKSLDTRQKFLETINEGN